MTPPQIPIWERIDHVGDILARVIANALAGILNHENVAPFTGW